MHEEMDDMEEIIDDFVTETGELLQMLDNDLIAMEKNPGDFELINKIFRAVHTIKGAAGFLGFDKIVTVVHNSESILNKCRQGELEVTPQINDTILKAADLLKILLGRIRSKDDAQVDITPVIQELQDYLGDVKEKEPAGMEDKTGKAKKTQVDEVALETELPGETSKAGQALVEEQKISSEQLNEALEERVTSPKIDEAPVDENPASNVNLESTLKKQGASPAPGMAEHTIRVDIDRLDEVLTLVGELVLGRNRIMQISSELEKSYESDLWVQSLTDAMSHMNMVTTDLQLAVMKTRMQPIKKIFNRFPKMVRDLAKSIKKEINLNIEGENTELDKSVIEEIADPLVHLIRNAVDHGMELPDEREAVGKPREGQLTLAAFYEGNNIIIEVRDDGKGMDSEKIVNRALEKGMINASDAGRMGERDKINLIFMPGFSTTQEVSNISGRGVGMDVVRNNVVKLSGTIDIRTEIGVGTTISIRLPLTVAIIQTLMVSVGEETFALPLASVVETVRTSPENIQHVDRQEVINLRGEVLPLVRLKDIFNIDWMETTNSDPGENWLYVVVIAIAEKKVGIVVEKLMGQEEVVIKSLGKYIDSKGIAGATILGNGKVTLIVDLGGLMEMIEERTDTSGKKEHAENKKIILLVDDSAMSRKSQKKALEAAGYLVMEAENGKEALGSLKSNPDIAGVVTDIIMPEMDGLEMVRKIKSTPGFKSLPVIAISVAEEKAEMEKGLQAGVNDYHSKSDIAGMVDSVRKLVR